MNSVRTSCLFALLSLALVQHPTFAASVGVDKWQEEILLQLSELRKSQGELKQQVADLRADVARAKSGAKPAAATSLDLRNASLPSFGPADADIAIVEFSDFQCPYCRQHVQKTWPTLRDKYLADGKVRYVFVDYPLSFHAQAMDAAIAGQCAHQQGAFWKMHDQLFENQRELGAPLYTRLASELGLDSAQFTACLTDKKVKREVAAHLSLGDSAGVQGTPAFVIGRLKDGKLTETRAIGGARPFEDFASVLDEYLGGTRAAQAE
jgi:protein-disulfide isomerase